jgi:hypothetical protein
MLPIFQVIMSSHFPTSTIINHKFAFKCFHSLCCLSLARSVCLSMIRVIRELACFLSYSMDMDILFVSTCYDYLVHDSSYSSFYLPLRPSPFLLWFLLPTHRFASMNLTSCLFLPRGLRTGSCL